MTDPKIEKLMRSIMYYDTAAIERTAKAQAGEFEAAVKMIVNMNPDRMIYTTGVGKSGMIAKRMAALFRTIGRSAMFLHPTDTRHGDLRIIRPADVAIFFSYSGATPEMHELANDLDERATPLIVLTGDPDSPLAYFADELLLIDVLDDGSASGLLPIASGAAMQSLGSALVACVAMLEEFDEKAYKIAHPAGT